LTTFNYNAQAAFWHRLQHLHTPTPTPISDCSFHSSPRLSQLIYRWKNYDAADCRLFYLISNIPVPSFGTYASCLVCVCVLLLHIQLICGWLLNMHFMVCLPKWCAKNCWVTCATSAILWQWTSEEWEGLSTHRWL